MTHEQRRQEFLKRRDIERAERTAAEVCLRSAQLNLLAR